LSAAIAVLERSLGIEVTASLTIKMLSASVQPAWIRLHIFSDPEKYPELVRVSSYIITRRLLGTSIGQGPM
jgi:hypothetical protein